MLLVSPTKKSIQRINVLSMVVTGRQCGGQLHKNIDWKQQSDTFVSVPWLHFAAALEYKTPLLALGHEIHCSEL